MNLLKENSYIIKDFEDILQRVTFKFYNDGTIDAQMFEGEVYKTNLRKDFFRDAKTLQDILFFNVIDTADDKETLEKVDSMVEDVINTYKGLFPNATYSNASTVELSQDIIRENDNQVVEVLVQHEKEKFIKEYVKSLLK